MLNKVRKETNLTNFCYIFSARSQKLPKTTINSHLGQLSDLGKSLLCVQSIAFWLLNLLSSSLLLSSLLSSLSSPILKKANPTKSFQIIKRLLKRMFRQLLRQLRRQLLGGCSGNHVGNCLGSCLDSSLGGCILHSCLLRLLLRHLIRWLLKRSYLGFSFGS